MKRVSDKRWVSPLPVGDYLLSGDEVTQRIDNNISLFRTEIHGTGF